MKIILLTLLHILCLELSLSKDIYVYNTNGSPISGVKFNLTYEDYAKIISDTSDVNGKLVLPNKNFTAIYFMHPDYNTIYLSGTKLKDKDTVIMDMYKATAVTKIRKQHNGDGAFTKTTSDINSKDIEKQNAGTSADLLNTSGEVYVQKSQLGGGSPMIRGFSANRILIVVDGVRMNNAIYRSGNIQNMLSIDPNYLEEADVIFGPGSISYGSDALGGVMDFETKDAVFTKSDKLKTRANILGRTSSAAIEKTGHGDLTIRNNRFSSFSSFSYSSFDDLKMGKQGDKEYLRKTYVEVLLNKDVEVSNSNPNKQIGSGFDNYHILQKFSYKTSEYLNLSYAFYYSNTSNIPRYDRLIQKSNNNLSYSKWEYGPQEWIMNRIGLKYTKKEVLFDELELTLAFQDYKESRMDRKFGEVIERTRSEKVNITTLNADFLKKMDSTSTLFYGSEIVSNLIGSSGITKDLSDNTIKRASTRYPDNSKWDSEALYAIYEIKKKNSTFQAGIRANFIQIEAQLDTSFFPFPVRSLSQSLANINGSLGWTHQFEKKHILGINLSSGYRAPNMDDLAKVFDSEPGNLIIPNPNLKSENAYSLDVSFKAITTKKSYVKMSLFGTYLDNAMVRSTTTINGMDSIYYDGIISAVNHLSNEDNAIIYGLQLKFKQILRPALYLTGTANIMQGETKNGNAVRHVSPAFGKIALQWKSKKLFAELNQIYNGEVKYNKLALSERNKAYIYNTDKEGNPYSKSWFTFNANVSYKWNKNMVVNAAIENILDKAYRPYSSGIAAPGRNYILSVKYKIY